MGMIKEFKEFAVKGNVIDMAVGIIIGAAFGKIVTKENCPHCQTKISLKATRCPNCTSELAAA